MLVFLLLRPNIFFKAYGIVQKMQSLHPWRVLTLCGSGCTGTNSGQTAAPQSFATGPLDSQTLVMRSV